MAYSPSKHFTIEYQGQTYTGSYKVEHRVITVYSDFGHKSTQLGMLSEEHLAESLLRELIREHQRKQK